MADFTRRNNRWTNTLGPDSGGCLRAYDHVVMSPQKRPTGSGHPVMILCFVTRYEPDEIDIAHEITPTMSSDVGSRSDSVVLLWRPLRLARNSISWLMRGAWEQLYEPHFLGPGNEPTDRNSLTGGKGNSTRNRLL